MLALIANTVGWRGAIALAKAYPGKHIYIPDKPTQWLSTLTGCDEAQKLVDEFGSSTIYIEDLHKEFSRHMRDKLITRLSKTLSPEYIADTMDISESLVRRIVRQNGQGTTELGGLRSRSAQNRASLKQKSKGV